MNELDTIEGAVIFGFCECYIRLDPGVRVHFPSGCVFSSKYEYPGRYTRWDIGFTKPPLRLEGWGRRFAVTALNGRGKVLLAAVAPVVKTLEAVTPGSVTLTESRLEATIKEPEQRVQEEERSRQPSIFSVVRGIRALFQSDRDEFLGLSGSFGYDLAFQFEPIKQSIHREASQRDIVLYIPDEIVVTDRGANVAWRHSYEFGTTEGGSTEGLPRDFTPRAFTRAEGIESSCDHEPGEYAAKVKLAQEKFKKGDLFEAVLSQTFTEPCKSTPSALFKMLQVRNPAPFGFLINIGEDEYLVGASPEMYVRVTGKRVETCPISGTIKRGKTPIEDAENIRTLLNSHKDESELTMCTDVDRNDKSRICVPGSVAVIGRRQIEKYSRLIHTVDHVEGTLKEGMDSLDAFLAHTWAVTVTGAPKVWAMQFLEDHEKSHRKWYAGSVGLIGFDGNMNTGLTLRTVHIQKGIATVRAGATLLYHSVPEDEEEETRVKASAFLGALREVGSVPRPVSPSPSRGETMPGRGVRMVMVDHQVRS